MLKFFRAIVSGYILNDRERADFGQSSFVEGVSTSYNVGILLDSYLSK